LALATLVLKDAPGNWTREKIEAAMNGMTSVRIDLAHPIDVLVLYATALATEAGPVMFFDDIYGYDRKLERQLGLEPVSWARRSPATDSAVIQDFDGARQLAEVEWVWRRVHLAGLLAGTGKSARGEIARP
jgi:hypothetical protein